MSQLYDAIGAGYQERRRPDPRLAAIRIGQRVKVVFKPTDGRPPVPMFTLA